MRKPVSLITGANGEIGHGLIEAGQENGRFTDSRFVHGVCSSDHVLPAGPIQLCNTLTAASGSLSTISESSSRSDEPALWKRRACG